MFMFKTYSHPGDMASDSNTVTSDGEHTIMFSPSWREVTCYDRYGYVPTNTSDVADSALIQGF